MQLPRPPLRLVASRDPEQHISASAPRGVPNRDAHPLLVALLGVALILALSWFLFGVQLMRGASGMQSGWGVPPGEDAGVPVEHEQPLPIQSGSYPRSGDSW